MAAVHSMAVVQYYRNRSGWTSELFPNPNWPAVEAAIRQMDNYCFPIVLLGTFSCDSSDDLFGNDDTFNIIGGAGRYALFQNTGPWQYEQPHGSIAEARLWESDQGYFCQERNVLTDLDKVIRIVHAYFQRGSYDELDSIT